MKTWKSRLAVTAAAVTAVLGMTACGGAAGASGPQLSLVGFSVAETANKAAEAKFQQTEAGKGVTFSGSYGASGDQSRKVAAGAKADYVQFSLESDVTRLVKAGLVSPDWNTNSTKGIVSESVVVLVVPKGNPQHITGWEDLTRPDVKVITPDPKSSGSARWNILGLYGHELATGKSAADASDFVTKVFANVTQWAGSGREATEAFDKKVGNVLISYENEAILARQKGKDYDYIVPKDTLLIENPGAVLSKADPKAKDWLDFVLSKDGQTQAAKAGFRPVIDGVKTDVQGANDPSNPFPTPDRLLTVGKDFGGWAAVDKKFFADGALIDQLRAAAVKK
ncbi:MULTISPECIES: sulfate ABC transporter substrate-binding protein [Arthrobacter]|uniref:Sulfate ABC transporter substrate-binding protein n=2 Tax=Arthrobacter TaxID=1663 RepID=A0ABU9KKV9_9MICC|nr:sulfate ABC transporter substrate-binding protein [Arthrobacter sp. YJM1]MDP5227545.1 sulfate ABC transporter substrate-binding protein [Arthrobacter sp. YJM1]